MNDEFLYRLRAAPPRDFALQLKARLDRQWMRRFTVRSRYLNGLGVVLLLGGAAYAITTLRGWWSADLEPPAASVAPASPAAADNASRTTQSRPPRVPATPQSGLRSPAVDAPARAARVPAQAGNEPQDGGGAHGVAPTLRGEQRNTDAPRGGLARDRISIVGAPATVPHSEGAVQFFARYDFVEPVIEVHPERDAVARFCNAQADVLVTFTRTSSDPPGLCAPGSPRRLLPSREPLVEPQVGIVEIEVGYEAVVLARSVLYGSVELPARAIFLALAHEVPDPRGARELVENPYRAWYEIDPLLPYDRIQLVGPAADSPAAQHSLAVIMEPGCAATAMHAWLGDVNASRYAEICRAVRSDGVYDESRPANDLVRELQTYPTVFGVLTYDLFDRNRTNLAAAAVNGVAPTQETLADGTYPASRTLYLYVQRMRTTRGLQELVESYLQVPQIARVLVPLDEAKRREMQVKAAELGGRR